MVLVALESSVKPRALNGPGDLTLFCPGLWLGIPEGRPGDAQREAEKPGFWTPASGTVLSSGPGPVPASAPAPRSGTRPWHGAVDLRQAQLSGRGGEGTHLFPKGHPASLGWGGPARRCDPPVAFSSLPSLGYFGSVLEGEWNCVGRSSELSKFIKLNYLLLKERASAAEAYHQKPASPPLLRPSMAHYLGETGGDFCFGLNKRQWEAQAPVRGKGAKSPKRSSTSAPNTWPFLQSVIRNAEDLRVCSQTASARGCPEHDLSRLLFRCLGGRQVEWKFFEGKEIP
ncbi:uncharacterized protein LOC102154437 isoform X5 [Canis lupus familiaris]|uniref:uncharacterized protein LOC102154437 isoform X5 n=1 Tax=Canis lupus familiaris TaxID=9615 RepID=UPI0015F1B8AB|nr:uncharacterized protein LOC102154437 isoform X5 [Canis lupus familiaris]XP_038418334.1 uncharacterized protein LOC102154437 isoform X4 [Canis lupus familiaris]